jgi:UDP-N-acetyl-D-galactosamine dehydrogenase
VTSGSTAETAQKVDKLYRSVITAGTFLASSIRVAEAAKVIENTQRDINIALINELALIFKRLNINTEEVLKAAGSKWNFLPFRPGLVGGHCIGVDPYYLTHKAMEVGYHPEIILAGRRLNDSMGQSVANEVITLMTKKRIAVVDANILIMGLTFKENCPDIRNTRVVDIVDALSQYHCAVDVYDPWIDGKESEAEYGIKPVEKLKSDHYEAIIIAVAHQQFMEMSASQIHSLGKSSHVLYDIKYVLPADEVDGRL